MAYHAVKNMMKITAAIYATLLFMFFLKYQIATDINVHFGLLYGGATIASLDNSCHYLSSGQCNDIWSCVDQIGKYHTVGSSYVTVTPTGSIPYMNESTAYSAASQDNILYASMLLSTITLYGQIAVFLLCLLCQSFCCSTSTLCSYLQLVILTISKLCSLTSMILFAISSVWLEKGFPSSTILWSTINLSFLMMIDLFTLVYCYLTRKVDENKEEEIQSLVN
jgi:hypothetical protein